MRRHAEAEGGGSVGLVRKRANIFKGSDNRSERPGYEPAPFDRIRDAGRWAAGQRQAGNAPLVDVLCSPFFPGGASDKGGAQRSTPHPPRFFR